MNTFTRTAPSAWASYLINGDDSGLDALEKLAADMFVKQYGAPEYCEDAGFIWVHDANHIDPRGADCQEYVFFSDDSEEAA